MTLSKSRYRANKIKMFFAVATIVCIRRTVYAGMLLPLTFSFSHQAHAVSAKPDAVPFNDVVGHWAEQYIIEAADRGVISAYEDGSFRPEAIIGRYEFAAMLCAALQIPQIAGTGASPKEEGNAHSSAACLQSLQDAGILQTGDFTADETEQALLPGVMLKLLLRALDPEAAEGQADLLWQKVVDVGLLDEEQEKQNALKGETVTRAEAVAAIQRLSRILGIK
jgi:hypothetical protein